MLIDVLILLAPIAIAFSFVYLYELELFLATLRRDSSEFWVELGSPTLGRATRTVAIPLLVGRFPKLESLDTRSRQRASRLRVYLATLSVFYAALIVALAFRRQLGWHL